VDLGDIMYTAPGTNESDLPSNRNPRDEALLCVTDLEDCCGTEAGSSTVRTVHGDWYFPDGRSVALATTGPRFLVNRGPNEIIDGQRVYGSVRLYRRWSKPPERGRFRCELPSTADPDVTQTLYVNIGE
jgi:hypothetical protein